MLFGSITLAIVWVSCRTFAEEFSPNDVPSEKRALMGFQGMRGKKDLASSVNEEFAKRAPMGFQGMRGKKDSGPDIEENLIAPGEESEKGGIMAFQGMRENNELLSPDFADSYFHDEYLKRAPMGFQGMRGKKAMLDDDYYQRESAGFQGLRGEKSLDVLLAEIRNGRNGISSGRSAYLMGYPDDHEKRARMMGFQGMRGKRQELEDEWEKRAPMGFQGMRGKKGLLEEMENFEKRARMGFQGMRGKKRIPSNYYDEYRLEQSEGYPENSQVSDHELVKWESVKRKSRGLIGTRGKRDAFRSTNDYPTISQYNFQDTLLDGVADEPFLRAGLRDRTNAAIPLQFDKRSPFGYLGTRGKKIPRWEIRRKFVGVRGKKWSPTPNYEDGNPLNNVPQ